MQQVPSGGIKVQYFICGATSTSTTCPTCFYSPITLHVLKAGSVLVWPQAGLELLLLH